MDKFDVPESVQGEFSSLIGVRFTTEAIFDSEFPTLDIEYLAFYTCLEHRMDVRPEFSTLMGRNSL